MSKKNFLGRALRSGLLATAAATMLMGNMAAFAAEDDEPAGIFWQENIISGTVTEVGTDSITVKVSGAMEEGGFAMGMPGNGMQQGPVNGGFGMGMPQDGQTPPELPDGQTPPERPEGELPDGQTPPERPDGELPDGQTPPELPDGERPELPDGELPELPEGMGDMTGRPQGMPQNGQMPEGGPENGRMPEGGMPQGGFGMGSQLSSEVTVSIDDATVVIKANGEDGTISDISEGSNVMVMLDGDLALSILVSN